MGWKDAPVITTTPAWKQAPREDEKRSAEDEKLASDVGTLLGFDEAERARVEAQRKGREAGPGATAAAGGLQGITRNFGDEVSSYGAVSGLPAWTSAIPGVGLARAGIGAVRALTDDDVARQREIELAKIRGQYEGAAETNPVSAIAGEVAGGLVGPVKGGPVRQIATGAVDAGVSGAGAGEDAGSRATGAAIGGTVGGVLGAAGQGLVAGGRALIRPLSRSGNVEAEAAGQVTSALEKDLSRLSPTERMERMQELDAAYARGQPVVVGDAGDQATRDLARNAGNTSSEAWQTVQEKTQPRFENQGERATKWWGDTTGSPDALTTRENLRATARAENDPNYKAAYEKGASVWDDQLKNLTASPTVQKAIREAAASSANEAAISGKPMVKNPFTVNPDGTLSLPEGATPSLEFWDHVQRNLRKQAEAAPRGGEEAREIGRLRDALNTNLDRAVPEFGQARSVARGYFGQEDALDAGRDFLKLSKAAGTAEERAAHARMTPAQKKLFAEGVVEDVRNRFNALQDNQEISRLFNSPEMRQRLEIALGPDRAGDLQKYLQVEKTMSQLKGALGNSSTARQLMGVLTQGGIGAAGVGTTTGAIGYLTGAEGGALPTTGTIVGALAGGLKAQNAKVNVQVANRVAEMLTSADPEILQRGIKILKHNRALREAFEALSGRITAVVGQQAGQAGAEGF